MDRSWSAGELTDLLGTWVVPRRPLYLALAEALRRHVAAGDLAIGDRLPAERSLATALAVSRSTVVAAYRRLRRDDVVVSARGSGTTVASAARSRPTTTDGRVAGGSAAPIFERLVTEPAGVISLARATGASSGAVGEVLREVVDEELPELLADPGTTRTVCGGCVRR